MDKGNHEMLFALLRSAIDGDKLDGEQLKELSSEELNMLLKLSAKHDIMHLLVLGLKQNNLISQEKKEIETCIFKAVMRYERIRSEFDELKQAVSNTSVCLSSAYFLIWSDVSSSILCSSSHNAIRIIKLPSLPYISQYVTNLILAQKHIIFNYTHSFLKVEILQLI